MVRDLPGATAFSKQNHVTSVLDPLNHPSLRLTQKVLRKLGGEGLRLLSKDMYPGPHLDVESRRGMLLQRLEDDWSQCQWVWG